MYVTYSTKLSPSGSSIVAWHLDAILPKTEKPEVIEAYTNAIDLVEDTINRGAWATFGPSDSYRLFVIDGES